MKRAARAGNGARAVAGDAELERVTAGDVAMSRGHCPMHCRDAGRGAPLVVSQR
jgi:hypothetical protein